MAWLIRARNDLQVAGAICPLARPALPAYHGQTMEPRPASTIPPLAPSVLRATLGRAARLTSQNWRLPEPEFYLAETAEVARALLGALLLHVRPAAVGGEPALCGGRIVETEAYVGAEDPACHAARGRTAVTEILYRRGGLAYIYLIYGMYDCLNAVTRPAGDAGAVLIRALEPMLGLESMAERRGLSLARARDFCSGPGRLCQALGITRTLNGADLRRGPLLILLGESPPGPIATGPRVGINKARDWPLRFWLEGNPWVSRAR